VPHALLLKADAESVLRQAGVDFGQQRDATSVDRGAHVTGEEDGAGGVESSDPAVARVAGEVRRATIGNILGAIVAAVEARPADDANFASLIFEAMAHGGGYHDAVTDTVKRRGIARAKGETPEAALAAHARSLDAKGLRALILELALARGAYFAWSTRYSERLTAAAAAYAIDVAAIEKTSAEQIASRQAERDRKRSKKGHAASAA
jgi:hypothetical protein